MHPEKIKNYLFGKFYKNIIELFGYTGIEDFIKYAERRFNREREEVNDD